MAEFGFNLLHNFHPKRDSYGFALRPQYAQRYREYSLIYKEEEDERSDKWRSFLEELANSSQPNYSENKHNKPLDAEGNEVKEERNTDRISNGDDSSSKKFSEGTDIREIGADGVTEDGSSGRKSAEGNETLEETILDGISEGGKSNCRKSSGGTVVKEGTGPGRVREGDDSSGTKTVSDSSTGNNSEKELQHSEGRKNRKVQRWAETRSSLAAIEEIMSSRVKKGKNMKGETRNGNHDHLPTIEESELLEGVSEEDIQDEVRTNVTLDKSINGATAENAQGSPQLFSPLKELEPLVQGGVPKDLRGEVWQAFVGVKVRRVESYYKDLLAQETNSGESNEQNVSSGAFGKWRKQIEKVISCMRLGLYFDLTYHELSQVILLWMKMAETP